VYDAAVHRLCAGSLLAALLLLSGCATSVPPIRPGAPFTPAADERVLWQHGEELDRMLLESGLVLDDPKLEALIGRVTQRLVGNRLDGTGLALRARVVRDPYRNAFVSPNGVVYVHTGLLAALDNEAQLAAVLGHEIAHFTGRHSLRKDRSRESRERAAELTDTVLDAAGGAGRLLDVATLGIGTFAFRTALEASSAGYSRDLEREADRFGFEYLASAGYDRADGVRVFAVLREELASEGIEEPFLFGSHPRLAERTESYLEMLRRDPGGAGERNEEAYRAAIQQALLVNAALDLEIGRPKLAAAAVRRHLALAPGSANGWYWNGEIARRRRSEAALDEAEQHYRHAVALAPLHPHALRALGLLLRERRREAESRALLHRYLDAAPGALDRELVAGYVAQSAPPPARARPRSEARCSRLARQQAEGCIARVGLWRLSVPEPMELTQDLPLDLERWLRSELVMAGYEVETPSELLHVWDRVERRIPAAGDPRDEEERGEALRLHVYHQLRLEHRLDALAMPYVVVVPGELVPLETSRREAALCLLVHATDLDGAPLGDGAACVGVIERAIPEGVDMTASARVLGSAMQRRSLSAEALRILFAAQ
jgi:predicted Zn-dependent protease